MTRGRPKFGKDYLGKEFQKYSFHLERPFVAYLIGGGAMAFRGLKNATKDVDFLVENAVDAAALVKTLEETGYRGRKVLAPDYEQMLASAVLENDDGFRVDLFTRKVCNALELTPSMKARAKERLVYPPNLEIRLVANEDLVLFKGITDRQGDLDDMEIIIRQVRLN